ncbi:T9SS type A sorting domain-containing protein [candidate division WOR-3 bacterium]|nr:T9SS type A sorting domain-containing protein [candidate division WOR-3 bacterium]
MRIYDINGRKIFEQDNIFLSSGSRVYRLKIRDAGISTGSYFVTINSSEKILHTEKFTVFE